MGHDWRSFEAGALSALDYITDEREDLEDLTMRVAEKIGVDIDAHRDRSNAHEVGRLALALEAANQREEALEQTITELHDEIERLRMEGDRLMGGQ